MLCAHCKEKLQLIFRWQNKVECYLNTESLIWEIPAILLCIRSFAGSADLSDLSHYLTCGWSQVGRLANDFSIINR